MAAKAKAKESKSQDPQFEGVDGSFDTYRLRGYVYAKLLEDGRVVYTSDGENFEFADEAEFREQYITVPPAKRDNSEHGYL